MIDTLFSCFLDPYNEKTIAEIEYVKHFEFTRPNGQEDMGSGFIIWMSNGHCIKALISDKDDDDNDDDTPLSLGKHGIFLTSSSDISIIGRQVDYAAWESELDPTCRNLLYGSLADRDMVLLLASGKDNVSKKDDVRFAIVGVALGNGTGAQIVAFNQSKANNNNNQSTIMYFECKGIREIKELS